MNPSDLKEILDNPAVSAEHKERVILQIGEQGDPVTELLQTVNKADLASVSYREVHEFCSARGWPKTRPLYLRWFDAYCTTATGQGDVERMAEYLRAHDFEEWRGAAEEWRDSGHKSFSRLIRVLDLIADSPNRGNYHSAETVEECQLLAVEMRRRAGEPQ
jgi:hypothetical protein